MSPEVHYCSATAMVPNSRLPVLIYRNALKEPCTEESIREQIEQNAWEHRVSHFATLRQQCWLCTIDCIADMSMLAGLRERGEAFHVTTFIRTHMKHTVRACLRFKLELARRGKSNILQQC